MSAYFTPPDGYEPPTHCERCGNTIIFGPVIGGHAWFHLVGNPDGHSVVMRAAGWWDVRTGQTRYGDGSDQLAATVAYGREIR